MAAVEDAVAMHPYPRKSRVTVKPDRIDIHAKEGPGYDVDELQELGIATPARVPKWMRDLDENLTQYIPVLRFHLHNAEQRTFRAEGRQMRNWAVSWRKLGPARGAGELARALVPNLGIETPYGFNVIEPGMPWSDWLAIRAGYWSPRGRVTSVHRLKVTLRDVRPPIWRRIEAPSTITLAYLHQILQTTMGWVDYHLHDFRVGDVAYGDPRQLEETTDQDEAKARLADVAPLPGNRMRYRYDFGDGWEHGIVVEAVGPPEPGGRYPICLGGKRACPPEDSGGPWGSTDKLNAIADRQHPMHDDMLEWLGGSFDPEAFDVEQVNRRLV